MLFTVKCMQGIFWVQMKTCQIKKFESYTYNTYYDKINDSSEFIKLKHWLYVTKILVYIDWNLLIAVYKRFMKYEKSIKLYSYIFFQPKWIWKQCWDSITRYNLYSCMTNALLKIRTSRLVEFISEHHCKFFSWSQTF